MAACDSDDLKLLFSLFDANRNGRLDKEEVIEMVKTVSGGEVDNDDIAKVMALIDANKDGFITIDEFEVMITKHVPMCPLGVRKLFDTFDTNGDGFVDKEEFNRVIQEKAGSIHERKKKFLKRILTRDDGEKVSYQQFMDSATEHYRNYVANRD